MSATEGSLDLAAIQARADAATAGPWRFGVRNSRTVQIVPDDGSDSFLRSEPGLAGVALARPADAEFIAHAREDVPALLAIVDRLTDALALAERAADTNYQLYKAGCEIIADRDTTLQVVRSYAQDRSYHAGKKNNTVSSWRIASDLLGILDPKADPAKEGSSS